MSSLWVKTWKSTPQIDCGLCGSATCAGFARALIVGHLQVNDCPLLELPKNVTLRESLETLRERSPTLVAKPAAKLPEGGVLFTRPCKDTDEKVMAELRVFNGVPEGEPLRFGVFDPELLCDLLECTASRFQLVRCSRDLGYARTEVNDMSITFIQDGRINMRRVSNQEEVLKLFHQLERSLLGATICNCCGNDLLSVLTGFAEPRGDQHPVLSAGSSLSLDRALVDNPPSKDEFKAIFGEESDSCVASLEVVFHSLIEELDRIRNGNSVSDRVSPDFARIVCDLVDLAAGTTDNRAATCALMVLALLRVAKRGIAGILGLSDLLTDIPESIRMDILKRLHAIADRNKDFSRDSVGGQIEAVAHMLRIERAVSLVSKWGWLT
ncbi:MAG: (Fe-S)-binding protein [Candidatus Thorarchaeota archaeon]